MSDRKREERDYRESQERLRLALKGGRMGTWDLNLESGHLASSDTCKGNYGRSPNDPFTYEDLAASVHEDDRPTWRNAVEHAIAKIGDFAVDYRVVTPSQEVRWVHVRGTCVTDPTGKVIGLAGVSSDISDRKRAEAEIADRELRYRLVANAANDAIWDWNLTTNQVVWNEGVRTNFGYAAEDVLADASWWVDRIHPDDVDDVTRKIHQYIDHGPDKWDGEYRFRRADGSFAVVFDRGVIVRDEAGKPVRMVGSMLDLTDKRRAEKALRAAEERFAFVRESSGVGFWYCDLPFDVLEWDERVKAHFHLPPHATVTIDDFFNLIHSDDREATRRAIDQSIRERGPYDVHYRTVCPDSGDETWVRAIGRTFYADDGTPTRFDGVTIDVTTQKRHEEELGRLLNDEKRHAALLERVASASGSMNSVLSAESIARILTEEARSILNAKVGATSFSDVHDCTQQVVVSDRTSDDQGGLPNIDEELSRRVCEENRPIRILGPHWCRVAAPLIAHGGKNLGVVQLAGCENGEFSAKDESILVQLAAIGSAGVENSRLYERLREQDRRKDEFLATLAHELRNPLAPVRTGLQILKAAPNLEETVETRAMMERQVGNMVRLIDDLLDVSRITRGKIDLKRERVDVSTIIAAAVEQSRPLIDTGQHSLFIAHQREPLPVDADHTRMAQVIANLLNNAAKYTPHGGRIEISAFRDGAQVVIRVQDNGVGIAAEMLPRVFDLFTQVGRSLDRSQGGLGIGLALVSRLVEMHGGQVFAQSEGAGKGSDFIVRLPLAEEVGAAVPGTQSPQESLQMTSKGRRILVVDDNVDGAKSLAKLLTIAGHTVETAFNGTDALTVSLDLRPEVVFLDIGLPGMNGYEVAQRLRSNLAMNNTYLVALTGWGTEDDQQRAREAGFDHHLTKPVDASEVVKLLAKLSTVRDGTPAE